MNSAFRSNPCADTASTLPDAPWSARVVASLLKQIDTGSLTVQWPGGRMQRFGHQDTPHATLILHNWRPLGAALKSGDIGFAEGYIDADWSTPNLTELLRVLLANRRGLDRVVYGSWLGRLGHRVQHLLHRNTQRNSAKNIHAHYDLGNAFYRLWLDDTLNYSSAWFDGNPQQTMAQAQCAKVRRALTSVGISPGQRLLEIGCGWGALAEMATRDFGAHVTGITLSTEQLSHARQRLAEAGLAERADLRLQDYRAVNDAPFDAICSIEMIEAVGQDYWPTYFQTLSGRLKPRGKACVQSIVIDDALLARYLRGTDFIQQYIFPGGCLPSRRALQAQAQAAGLQALDELAFGADYAATLAWWRERFLAQRPAVLALGFDERFCRIWEFYLAYCEAAFLDGSVDVVQFTWLKP